LLILLVCFAALALSQRPLTWSPSIANIVPKPVYDYLNKFGWGTYHIMFHMSRHWYTMGDQGQRWLTSQGERAADLQEGDPSNGVEFLTMHRAMIEHLREKFGKVPVTNDPEGRKTFGDVLNGWTTDDQVIAGLTRQRGDVARFKAGLSTANNFKAFASEDDFGQYLQTSMKLSGQVDPQNSAIRFYARDPRPGAGVHNWLHGQFQDAQSPIDVGDPSTNLANIMFWRIHGWIEAKWQQYEKTHTRKSWEQDDYDHMMERFRLHMQLHSDFAQTSKVVRVPPAVLAAVKPALFSNRPPCRGLAVGTTTADCPQGRPNTAQRRVSRAGDVLGN